MDPDLLSFSGEICTYLADNSDLFVFDSSADGNLKVGELTRGINGVFAVQAQSPLPDKYTDVEYFNIDFWAVNTNSQEAFFHLREIDRILHQAHHYNTTSFVVYFSHATSTIADLDRDSSGRKLLRLGVQFIAARLIS